MADRRWMEKIVKVVHDTWDPNGKHSRRVTARYVPITKIYDYLRSVKAGTEYLSWI